MQIFNLYVCLSHYTYDPAEDAQVQQHTDKSKKQTPLADILIPAQQSF